MKTNLTPSLLFFKPLVLLLLLWTTSCGVASQSGSASDFTDIRPDYANPDFWAALPQKEDPADRTPSPKLVNAQDTAQADVFFLHPTSHSSKRSAIYWNAPLMDESINQKTDQSSILYQASLFNGAGKVYAPRYRQAHLQAYYTKNRSKAMEAFQLAYEDVKNAFQYYLEHYNQGRPIIIAAHSQGTTHAKTLIKEFFDGKPLSRQLVAAYLVGMPVESTYFDNIPPCTTPEQTGCFCSWRTYKTGRYPKYDPKDVEIVATNPLTWTTDATYAPKTINQGAVLMKFEKILPELSDAQVHEGLVWIKKPRFPGSFLYWNPNYHAGDYNLFYLNVRNNAILRVNTFLKQ